MSAPRERAILVPSSELRWLAMTPDQARILWQLVRENRASITERWSWGIFDGLSQSLCEINNAGGAYTPTPHLGGYPLHPLDLS